MTLGEKILQARQEAGLSQRQLCGQEITRNMLSQIEHGTARPSMATLQYLAARLGKSVSYFLEEEAVVSPNWDLMRHARAAYAAGDFEKTRLLLHGYQQQDHIFDREYAFLSGMTGLEAARTAIAQGKTRYAQGLLEEAKAHAAQFPGLERQRLLLLGQLPQQNLQSICDQLPSLDEELILRGRAALESGDTDRAVRWLDAVQDRSDSGWNLLRGKCAVQLGFYEEAAECLHRSEEALPLEAARLLEQCYRELGDYKRAYEYACKQR